MKTPFKLLLLLFLTTLSTKSFSQKIIKDYEPVKNDSLKIGIGENDFLPFIQKGYTLMLPENKKIKGVLIFLEDSKYNKKNFSSKQIYNQASISNFGVLSISTEIPLDFYFSKSSIKSTHNLIQKIFKKFNLPNENIFFLGAGLVGHRAMKYIEFINKEDSDFKINIKGVVICDFTLDWIRKWQQHKRDIKINRINLWEPTFMNFMLETYLKGTPKTAQDNYHNFSTYSYSNQNNENINFYKNYAVRAYIEPKIKYRLKKYYRTLYENNATDIVGFLAELELAGNKNTELVILQPEYNQSENRNTQTTWNKIDKYELMNWINKQTEK
ncbi:hypothetical protein [Polaribacter sp.]|uniref:hypothetical protein n=1 Tax=Polaribacter sp. TaxID=1920175 RepID=UPI0035C7EB2F